MDSWTLPLLVVYKLVSLLKLTQRWRLDGPSLRLINKQWSHLIDHFIVEVRPHHDRFLVPEDIMSLRKFPQLTSVDVQPFILSDTVSLKSLAPAGNSASGDETKLSFSDYDITRVVDVLLQLPKLSHLEVGSSIVRKRRAGRNSSLHTAWTELASVTSLYIYNDVNLKLCGTSPSNAFGFLRVAEKRNPMRLEHSGDLISFISLFPRIRNVEISVSEKEIGASEYLHRLDEIEGLKLHVAGSCRFISSISNQSAVVGVALHLEVSPALDFLVPFERLESLKMRVELPSHLPDETSVTVFRRLTSLTLVSQSFCLISDECFDAFDQLRDLTMDGIAFYGAHLKGKLLNLTSLGLSGKVRDGCLSFLADMENLKHLGLGSMYNTNRKRMTHHLNDLRLPQGVRSLYLNHVSKRTIDCITRLAQLELVFMEFSTDVTMTDVSKLERLPALRILGLFDSPFRERDRVDDPRPPVFFPGHQLPRKDPERVNKFLSPSLLSPVLLTRLDRLVLNDRHSGNEQMLKILREKAPRLIVEFECTKPHLTQNVDVL